MLDSGCGVELQKQGEDILEPPEEARTHVQKLYLQQCGCVCGSNWAALLKHRVAHIETVKEYHAI
jgi:hypothetical protein